MHKDNYLKEFGQHLQKLRKDKGISQEYLAFQINIDRTYLSGIERGVRNPCLFNIYRLAQALCVSTSELFRFERKKYE
jgi:transcriptional regulator with XRE-family HTH domain